MSIRDSLIPREKIPAGCRWEGSRWNPGEAPRMHADDMLNLQKSVAYYDLVDALAELVDAVRDLNRAKQRHGTATNRLLIAEGRSEYIQELPIPPWQINGHVVREMPRSDNLGYVVEPLADMDHTT